MKNKIRELLYQSFDRPLSDDEQKRLADALKSSAELREEQARIREMRELLSRGAKRSFRPFFSARVMRKVHAQATREEDFFTSLAWLFRRIAVAGTVAIVLMLAGRFVSAGDVSLEALLGQSQPSLEETWQLTNPLLEGNES